MPFNEDYIFETLKRGTEYGIDGAVIEGKFYLVLLREKIITPFPFSQSIGVYSTNFKDIKQTIYNKILDYMQKCVTILKIENSLINCDLILDENENPFAIEFAPRPSGHNMHNNFTIHATGINMVKEYLNFIRGKSYNFSPKYIKNMMIRFFDFENCRIRKIPNFEQLKSKLNIIEYKCNIGSEVLGKVKDGNSIINRGYFIIEGGSKKTLKMNADYILNLFEKEKI